MPLYRVTVDGQPYEVAVEDADPGRCRVEVAGRAFEVEVGAGGEAGDPRPAPAPRTPALGAAAPTPGASPLAPPSAPRTAAVVGPAANGAGASVLRAPMPGVILRIHVAAGARVQRGQDIAVLEAMKMENVIRAPQAGTVTEICVQPGDQVAHGAPIVRFAAAS